MTTVDETVEFIGWAQEAGLDAIDLSRGNARSLATVYEVPPYNLEPGFNMDNIAAIKARVNIPVIGVGRIVDPALAIMRPLIRRHGGDDRHGRRRPCSSPIGKWCNRLHRVHGRPRAGSPTCIGNACEPCRTLQYLMLPCYLEPGFNMEQYRRHQGAR